MMKSEYENKRNKIVGGSCTYKKKPASLFPSILVSLAIKTIASKCCFLEQYTSIPKSTVIELLLFCTKEGRYFKYAYKFYEEIKLMPKALLYSSITAHIIMEELLDQTLEKIEYKLKIITKYVDDLFTILNILNVFHKGIQYTMENEKDYKLSYLDAAIIAKDKLKLDWYQTPMCAGRLINFYCKHLKEIIFNTVINVIKISD